MKNLIPFLLLSCGTATPPLTEFSPDLRKELEGRIEEVKTWLPYCTYDISMESMYRPGETIQGISKYTCTGRDLEYGTGDGDVTLYAGYMCLAGDSVSCEIVKASQDITGRVWRSPARVGNPQGFENTFSRDMFLGVLFYLAATKDQQFALSYNNWIISNNYRLCNDDSDGRCIPTPNMLALQSYVWEYIGLTPTAPMLLARSGNETNILTASQTAPLSYETELIASQIFLRQYMGTYTPLLEMAAENLYVRQPTNPYYLFVYKRYKDRVAELMLQQIPREVPQFRVVWSISVNEQFDRSMGWEWIYLYLLLTKL